MIFRLRHILLPTIAFLLTVNACRNGHRFASYGTNSFNNRWQFLLDSTADTKSILSNTDGSQYNWQEITLPHTPVIEPLVMTNGQWQGTCWYRKVFDNPGRTGYENIILRFGAAMHTAYIWLNGELIKTHHGGYLPFIIDLTGKLKEKDNILVVELNNEDDPEIPPGKPLKRLDFNFYGGLYRGIDLVVRKPVHISDPCDETPGKGPKGVFIKQEKADRLLAVFSIDVDVANDGDVAAETGLRISVKDDNDRVIKSEESAITTIEALSDQTFTQQFYIENPSLWSPENPHLYKIEIEVLDRGRITERKIIKTGFRDIRFHADGFELNGKRLWLRGTNRHQEYPYVGYAIGPEANRRDAFKIKEAGFNFVRCSHYPQSEAFLDACDELGIMVMNAIPGWQFMGDLVFAERVKIDVREMIRRDRNHPAVILWESSLNETWMEPSFIAELNNISKEELDGINAYTCGWIDTIWDVFIPARQHSKPPHYWNDYSIEKPLLIAEYGDWEYYAQNAGFNQEGYEELLPDERSSRQLRGNGQKRLARQALNFQEAHNDNLSGEHAGDANWLMFDYNRGYSPDIESSGIMDIFRLPKFSYWFYRSQKELLERDTVLFIANYWNDPSFNDVRVYSNCDEIEITVNGKVIGRSTPDNDRYSVNLSHPPFTFRSVTYEPGVLKAQGYVNGKPVKTATVTTYGDPVALELKADISGRPLLHGGDIIFIYATTTDSMGNVVRDADTRVLFTVKGDATLVGANPAVTEAGTATILLKTGNKPGKVMISATGNKLTNGTLKIKIR